MDIIDTKEATEVSEEITKEMKMNQRIESNREWFEKILPICKDLDEKHNKATDELKHSEGWKKVDKNKLEKEEIRHMEEKILFDGKEIAFKTAVFLNPDFDVLELAIGDMECRSELSCQWIMQKFVPRLMVCLTIENAQLFSKVVPVMMRMVQSIMEGKAEVRDGNVFFKTKEEVDEDVKKKIEEAKKLVNNNIVIESSKNE